jgi:signal transduction histidine kinase
MKFLFIILFSFLVSPDVYGQNVRSDSLKYLLGKAPQDTTRLDLLLETASEYYFSQPDSCLFYSLQALDLSRKLNRPIQEITSLESAGEASRFLGNYPTALKMQFDALELSRKINDKENEGICLGFIGFTYVDFGEYRHALPYLFSSLEISHQLANKVSYTFGLSNIGNAYDRLDMKDSALYFQNKSFESYAGLTHGPLKSLVLSRIGNVYYHNGELDSAMNFYRLALANSVLVNDKVNVSRVQGQIANIFLDQKNYDSSIMYARQAYASGDFSVQRRELMENSLLLSRLHRQMNRYDSALYYQDIAIEMRDSLYGPNKFRQLQLLMLSEQQRQQAMEQEQQQYRNRIKYTVLFVALGAVLLVSLLLLQNNRQKQKAKVKIEHAYDNLKATQQKLIQSEKMASLGELTAGIAHEIQNPLNFVNNFAEVNAELIDELDKEMENGNLAAAKTIAKNIKENEQKINHHGKRADAIVKGMLQHSRSNSGVKELTDINRLTDEYLRLAYHGLRAKDKSFNATLKTDYDPSLGVINVMPQDIGRTILNLITNAFYAVTEKRKQVGEGYEPTVTVTTKNMGDKTHVGVKDNGNGIPKKVLDKIFQPFFTTKPTGQGTGLGLSLSYDIVKAHGGELKVQTSEGEGTEFIISIPK